MKDYWRLIGITSEKPADYQVRQAHFRAFRYYQGDKNNAVNANDREEAERVIKYLRSAHDNPDLPLPDDLKHLLKSVAGSPSPSGDGSAHPAPPDDKIVPPNDKIVPPTDKLVPPTDKLVPPTDDLEQSTELTLDVFENDNIEDIAHAILDSRPAPDQDEMTQRLHRLGHLFQIERRQPAPDQAEMTLQPDDIAMSDETRPADRPIDEFGYDDIILEPELEPGPTLQSMQDGSFVDMPKGDRVGGNSSGRQIIVGDVINCPECGLEIITETDSFCSGCGKGITSVEVPKELLIYAGENGSYTTSFTIKNNGLIPIEISDFQVIDIDVDVQPNKSTFLGKNDSVTLRLSVLKENRFGKPMGEFRFRYHGKPEVLSMQLKEPPRVVLSFPDVPNQQQTPEEFHLYLPIDQKNITCSVSVEDDTQLVINSVKLDANTRNPVAKITEFAPAAVRKGEPVVFQIENPSTDDFILIIEFRELGSRQYRLILKRVKVPILVDKVGIQLIGEHAIILGSGVCGMELAIKNEGQGSAHKIELQGLPDWLIVESPVIDRLDSGKSGSFSIKINSSKITKPGNEHVELKLRYFDPQLGWHQTRRESVNLAFQFVEPKEFNGWIAIDFGTSNSCAAIMNSMDFRSLIVDAKPNAVGPNASLRESPTCIQFVDVEKENYDCGASAYSKRFSGIQAMKSTAWAFKRQLLHSDESITNTYLDILHSRPHRKTVDELITIYAGALIKNVKLRNGIAPRKAIVTFPVLFDKSRRGRLAKAFLAAGFEEVVTSVSEPVALALCYASLPTHTEIFSKSAAFAVFDFGGGTTDIAIFQICEKASEGDQANLRLLDVDGIDIGGELLTFELARLIYEQLVPADKRPYFGFPKDLGELNKSNIDMLHDNFGRLAELAENVKRSCYSDPEIFEREHDISLSDGSDDKAYHSFKTLLNRTAVEELLKSRIKELIDALIEMVESLKDRGIIKERKLDWVVLGGNSSRLSLVTDMMAESLFEGDRSKVLFDVDNIKLGVTNGALIYATAPEALPFPIDQVNHTLPCHIGILESNFKFSVIFERGLIAQRDGIEEKRKVALHNGILPLYYYFGHKKSPMPLRNPKMKKIEILFPVVTDKPIEVTFKLLPNSEGVEVAAQDENGHESKFIAPILSGI